MSSPELRGGIVESGIAADYDHLHGAMGAPHAVDFLAALADGGTALELGIGTGRIALPLASKGVAVTGLDASPEMLRRLRAKDHRAGIQTVAGDMASFALPGRFDLVYVVYNAIYGLLSQELQLSCVRSAATHLTQGGSLVIEAFVPSARRLSGTEVKDVTTAEGRVVVSVGGHDSLSQVLDLRQIHVLESRKVEYPLRYRYIWLSELDLMARIAGLSLAERWAGWSREEFTTASSNHVSVYRPTAALGHRAGGERECYAD